jgi:hypothetical protein
MSRLSFNVVRLTPPARKRRSALMIMLTALAWSFTILPWLLLLAIWLMVRQ